jgi:ParB family chromosome partitioning protein
VKSANDLMARLGGNMRESMGANRPAEPGPPAAALHGETSAKYHGASRVKDALSIEVERITPDPDQPRKEFDPESLSHLAESLKTRGQLQPIRVRWDGGGSRWVIVVGERRYRAALMAGLPSLLCLEVKGEPTPDDILEDQLVENCLRQDLRPVEQARAFRTLLDRRGWSYRRLAEALHIAPASVARALALLDLPAGVQERVEQGVLPPATAYEIARVSDPASQAELAERIVSEGLSRAETVAAVKQASGRPARAKGKGGRAGKVTERVLKTSAGRVTVENRKGLTPESLRTALAEALALVDAEGGAPGQAAA